MDSTKLTLARDKFNGAGKGQINYMTLLPVLLFRGLSGRINFNANKKQY
jgi:hypothetical protein